MSAFRFALAAFIILLLMIPTTAVAAKAPAKKPVKKPATGVPIGGKAWKPGQTLRVYNAAGAIYNKSLDAALRDINASGARIKLVKTPRKGNANIIVRTGSLRETGFAPAVADLGRKPRGPSQVIVAKPVASAFLDNGKSPYGAAYLLTHELLHNLTLNHPSSPRLCSVMNAGFFRLCPTGEAAGNDPFPGLFTCRFMQQRDKQTLVNVYGGKVSKPGPLACSVGTGLPPVIPPRPSDVSVEVPADGEVLATLRWRPVSGAFVEIQRFHKPCGQVNPAREAGEGFVALVGDRVSSAAGVIVDKSFSPYDFDTAKEVCYTIQYFRLSDGGSSPLTKVGATIPARPMPTEE